VYLRLTLGLLFLIAGLLKAWDRRAFQVAVTSFRILPSRFTASVAALIVTIELVASLLLLAGIYEWLAAFMLGALLAAFTIAIAVNLHRGRIHLDCRCFGQPTISIGWAHVVQNILMLAVAIVIGVGALQGNPRSGGIWGTTALLTTLESVFTAVAFLAVQEMISTRERLQWVMGRGIQAG
jgi:putative oxidoreductase